MGHGLEIVPGLVLAADELLERFVRASGPGGQHVDKVATAAELRFDIAGSPSLPEPLRARLLARSDRRLTGDGVLVIFASRHRSQDRNRQDARERLRRWIREGLTLPAQRLPTRPGRAAVERRLRLKRRRSVIKGQRKARLELD